MNRTYHVTVSDDTGIRTVDVVAECGCTHDMQAFIDSIPDFVNPEVVEVVAA